MKLWPHDHFEIDTPMSPKEILAALHERVEPTKRFRWFGDHKTFQGTITGESFKFTRIIGYSNSSLPVITGSFLPGRVTVTMRLQRFVTVCTCIWLAFPALFAGVIGVVALVGLFRGQLEWNAMLLIPFGMVLFVWAMTWASYSFEARKAKRILIEMFDGQLASEPTSEEAAAFPSPTRGRETKRTGSDEWPKD